MPERIKADAVLKIGQRIEFFLDDDDEKYASRIEDITPTELVVAMPVDKKRRPVLPLSGQRLYGLAIGEQCRYQFFSVFHDKAMQQVPVWIISKPDLVERKQNREFVRVRVNLLAQVQVMNQTGGFSPPTEIRVIDISGNGLAFAFSEPVAVDVQVAIEIHNVPEVGTLRAMGRVMRCTVVETSKGRVYQVGVRLLTLTPAVRNRLVRYIFEVQRRALAKGIEMDEV